jgi:predicted MFS family arabinose efflux permease
MLSKILDFSFIRRNPNFMRFWASYMFFLSGARMAQMASVWWVLSRPESSFGLGRGMASGLVLAAGVLPPILLAKWIGKKVETVGPKRLMLTTSFAAALLSFLTWAGIEGGLFGIVLLLVFSLLMSLLQALVDPTLGKATPNLVGPEDRDMGVALIVASNSLTHLIGAVTGGLAIEFLGTRDAFAFNLLCALAAFVLLMGANGDISMNDRRSKSRDATQSRYDFGFLASYPTVKWVVLGLMVHNFLMQSTSLLLSAFVKVSSFPNPERALTLLQTAVCAGGLIGNLFSQKLTLKRGSLRTGSILRAFAGVGLIVLGLVQGLEANMTVVFFATLMVGASTVKFILYFHDSIPVELKGRFFSLFQAFTSVSLSVSYVVFGFLGDRMSIPSLFWMQGIGMIAVSLFLLSADARRQKMLPT